MFLKKLKFIQIFFVLILLSNPLVQAKENTFDIAKIGYNYKFPADHQAHGKFASEWWYYTGILHVGDQRSFGYQLTFFRVGLKPAEPSVYIAHFALSDLKDKKFYYFDRINRPLLQMANWSAEIQNNENFLKAIADNIKIDLKLQSAQNPVIHGKPEEKISRKGNCPSCASHYYSLPNLHTSGEIKIGEETFYAEGLSWMDHEFGSSQLQSNQTGWDWFGLHFNDGSSLMLYQLRESTGKTSPYSQGTYISADGKAQHLSQKEIFMHPVKSWFSPQSKTFYPLVWEITVPKLDLGLKVLPLALDQELQTKNSTRISYWEGAVKAIDRVSGKKTGEGYLELTGYAGSLKGKF